MKVTERSPRHSDALDTETKSSATSSTSRPTSSVQFSVTPLPDQGALPTNTAVATVSASLAETPPVLCSPLSTWLLGGARLAGVIREFGEFIKHTRAVVCACHSYAYHSCAVCVFVPLSVVLPASSSSLVSGPVARPHFPRAPLCAARVSSIIAPLHTVQALLRWRELIGKH